jgi:hypothetical protein
MAPCGANFKEIWLIMKNIVIDNQGLQSQNKNQNQTKLESQIEQLKTSEQQLAKQLRLWESKAKKANNLANCLITAEKFGKQLLADFVELEKSQEQPDSWAWEYLLKDKIEFSLKFEVGKEAFMELILKVTERELNSLRQRLARTQSQLQHEERKFARLQARRQGKILLNCEYKKPIGCFGEYQCDNCQVNYPVTENEALKGGSY